MKLVRRGKKDERSLDETPAVRQYRYLLRTASADALIDITRVGLAALNQDDRQAVLTTVQQKLVAGARLTADHVGELARLVSLGERREPSVLLPHIQPDALQRLAVAALKAGSATGLLHGYAAWDGVDPQRPTSEARDGQFAPTRLNSEHRYQIVKGRADAGFGT